MLRRISDTIELCGSFLITAHVRPDGDAIGSELALYNVLKDMGKEVLVYNQDKTPDNYLFLPGSESIVHELKDPKRYDAVFVLDSSDLERIGDLASRVGALKRIINVDHHVSNTGFCELAFVDSGASSTGEMLYRLFQYMKIVPTKDVAQCLYAAILTDTGGFRYGSTKKETLLAAGELVGAGAEPQWLSENIYENYPLEKFALLTEVLRTLTLDLDDQVASVVVSLAAIARTGALSEHIEGFVDIPRTIKGVKVAILYLEVSENVYKLSMRSKGKVNVEQLARHFGGGGHTNAAACQVRGELGAIRQEVTEALRAIL